MKKLAVPFFLCLLASACVHAQREIRDNTFGGIGAGLLSPQGYYKNNVNSGFQVNAEINGRIYRPLWFTVALAYENLPVTNTILVSSGPISTIGGGLGLKLFLLKFLYAYGGGGIRGVVSGTIPNSDRSTLYFNAGAGIYPVKFLSIFAEYNSWQAQTGYPANNYFVGGLKLSFGRK